MLTSATRAAAIVSLVAALVACGGDGGPYPDDGVQGTSSATGDTTAGETAGTTAADTGAADPRLALCVASCTHRAECVGVDTTLEACELECGPVYEGVPERCYGEIDGVFICAALLDCKVAADFDVGEPMGPCGDRISAYRTCVAG